jgi:DNA modification methylase
MTASLIIGDVFEALATLPDASVDLCVSSPPFLALRSYLPADHALKSDEKLVRERVGLFMGDVRAVDNRLREV